MFFALRDFSILLRYLRRFAYSVRRDKGCTACAEGELFCFPSAGFAFGAIHPPCVGATISPQASTIAAGNSSFLRHRKPLFAGEVVERF